MLHNAIYLPISIWWSILRWIWVSQSPSVFFQHLFSALALLVGWQEGHPACKKNDWWGAGVVICLGRDADLHTAQLMPLPPTVSCFSKIQIGFTFLLPAHPGSHGQRAVKRVLLFWKRTIGDKWHRCFIKWGWNRLLVYLAVQRCRIFWGCLAWCICSFSELHIVMLLNNSKDNKYSRM